jgi:hypothetical protein
VILFINIFDLLCVILWPDSGNFIVTLYYYNKFQDPNLKDLRYDLLRASKGCHLDVVGGPSTPHDPESDAGGSLSSWQGHPSW